MPNERYGLLTVVGAAPSVRQTNGKLKGAVMARCECGVEKSFILSNLKSGNSTSCGCQKNRGMQAFNAERATPQIWTIDGDTAHIDIKGKRVWVDASDVPLVGAYRWGFQRGYAVARGGRLSMHRLILGLEHGDPREGDHRHQNTLDNRRAEIRVANSSQNKMNRRGNRGASSPFKGVHYDHARGKFLAQIKIGEGRRYLGRFSSEADAAAAYDRAAAKGFGEFAWLNSNALEGAL